MAERIPIEQRFWPKVNKNGSAPEHRPDLEACWEWMAFRQPDGYGQLGRGGKRGGFVLAHRFAYELLVGPIPEGLQIDHLCRNRSCVNPAHLEPVTLVENLRRGERAQQTHCKRGHPFDDANTYRSPNGHRHCRACRRLLLIASGSRA